MHQAITDLDPMIVRAELGAIHSAGHPMTCDVRDELDPFHVIRDRHLFELLSFIVAGAIPAPCPHRNDRIRATELRGRAAQAQLDREQILFAVGAHLKPHPALSALLEVREHRGDVVHPAARAFVRRDPVGELDTIRAVAQPPRLQLAVLAAAVTRERVAVVASLTTRLVDLPIAAALTWRLPAQKQRR